MGGQTAQVLPVEVCDYKPRLLPQLFALFSSHFESGDRLLSESYSNWLYLDNPNGKAKIVLVPAETAWAAFMALVPVHLTHERQIRLAYFVVNVLVDPRQRGKNLFGKMISVAADVARSENAILVGHPNTAALKGWQKAHMHFHEDLRPSIAAPLHWFGAARAQSVMDPAKIEDVLHAIDAHARPGAAWKVSLSPAYLRWRFVVHPTNSYTIQALGFPDGIRGLQIYRTLKHRRHLLIDQFVDEVHAAEAYRLLPFATVCFLPRTQSSALRSSLLPLPLTRRIHVFADVDDKDANALGLSATDM